MGATGSLKFEVELTTGVWTDITADTDAASGLSFGYGINGNKPLDSIAGVGTLEFALNNWQTAAGRPEGYYSPNHASVRSGWTFGKVFRLVAATGSTAAVTSITESAGTATVTTAAPHGRSTGDYVTIADAVETDYNGTFQITVTGASTFTYVVANSPSSPATGTITVIRSALKFYGKIDTILPIAGQSKEKRVLVTVNDTIADVLEADVRELDLQINKTEAECLTAILDSLPSSAQPPARDFDTGVDTFPWAFDDLGSGVKGLALVKDAVQSALGMYFAKGDGTHAYRSRTSRATGSSVFTFADSMHGLNVPSGLDGVFNRVGVTVNKKVVSANPDEELYTLPTGAFIEVTDGGTVKLFTDYTDPNDRQTSIGGSEVVTTLVAGTHFQAFANSDGTGSDLSASMTPTLADFGSSAKWTFVNAAGQTAYVTLQKVIGKAVRNPGPQRAESYVAKGYGDRPLEINLRYQDDLEIGQSAATYTRSQNDSLSHQMESLMFIANDSQAFMGEAVYREIGDRITVTEQVTGLALVDAIIQRVEWKVSAGPWIECTFGLAPASTLAFWLWGVVGQSEWGETTYYGF